MTEPHQSDSPPSDNKKKIKRRCQWRVDFREKERERERSRRRAAGLSEIIALWSRQDQSGSSVADSEDRVLWLTPPFCCCVQTRRIGLIDALICSRLALHHICPALALSLSLSHSLFRSLSIIFILYSFFHALAHTLISLKFDI